MIIELGKYARVASLLILGVLIFATAFFLAPSILSKQADHEAIAARSMSEKATLQAYIESRDALKMEADRLSATLASDQGLLAAPTMVVAQDILQSKLRNALQSHGGSLASFSLSQPLLVGSLSQIRLTATFSIQEMQLPDLLTQVESGSPRLYVEKMAISAPRMSDAAATNPLLSIQGEFSAFVRVEGTK